MRQGDENGRNKDKDVRNRRAKTPGSCKISVGGHIDHHVLSTVQIGYIEKFGHLR